MSTQVTINDVEPRTQAVAFADQITFNTNWTANAATDVVVYRRAAALPADDQTQLVSQNDYNVEFIGTYETVRITFLVACNEGDIVTITRATPSDRENLYTNTNFTPSMLNQDFGILTLVDQQNQMYDQDFCPHYNLSATYTNTADIAIDLILPILGANQFWAKNGDNDAIVAVDITESGGGAPITDPFVTYKASGLPNAFDLGTLTSGLLAVTVSGAIATPYSTLTPTLTSVAFSPSTGGIVGTITNNNASSGFVGEVISVNIPLSSAIPLTNDVISNINTITVSAGDWDIYGNVTFSGADNMSQVVFWTSFTSATLPNASNASVYRSTNLFNSFGGQTPILRASTNGQVVVYLSCVATFASATVVACGNIFARRVR